MKKILLSVFILLSLSQVKASDTLTVRQVFNFNVGDTFDYAITLNTYIANGSGNTISGSDFERYLIIGKDTSTNNDTITYTRLQLYPNTNQIDYLQYYNLDSNIWLSFDTLTDTPYFSIDTGILSDGRTTNTLIYNGLNFYNNCELGQGIGVMDTITNSFSYSIDAFNEISLNGAYNRTLIYFSKGADQYGTPYYIANGSPLVHYTPIPEDCAYWNYSLSFEQSGGQSGNTGQIRTGGKEYINGHTYVELLYRSNINNVVSADTILGYFRNDTAGRMVYFCQQPGVNDSVLYNFNVIDSLVPGPNFYSVNVSQEYFGNIERTVWYFEGMDPFDDAGYAQTIEGIGSIYGLFPSPVYLYSPFESTQSFPTRLNSFCVCGETLYPDTASGQCTLLTGINTIPSPATIKLYPNPTTDQLHLSFGDTYPNHAQLIITDILGQEVYSSTIMQSETVHDISRLSSGIYTWRVVEDNAIIKTGKVVKE